MESKISKAIKFKYLPVAIILSDEKPEEGLQFKEGTWGCVSSMLFASSKGKTAFFNRKTFGCIGGGTGLGFGNRYKNFPIDCFLSTGTKDIQTNIRTRTSLEEGEAYIKTPELAKKFIDTLPIRDVPTEYVIFKPLQLVGDNVKPEMIIFFANPDQISALVVLANYGRKSCESVISPFCAGCQSILYGYAEAEKDKPVAILGMFDITARKFVDKNLLSFTIPFKMFEEMETNVKESFLEREQWLELNKRNVLQ
jgi:uncharacterized protein (DUF169 family)